MELVRSAPQEQLRLLMALPAPTVQRTSAWLEVNVSAQLALPLTQPECVLFALVFPTASS